MARKFGVVNQVSSKFEDYNYMICGVGGIGKTTMVQQIGEIITGSPEGTFIITCGVEPVPAHIRNAFYAKAPDFKTFVEIVDELCNNKGEYPNTKFVAIDSLDEYCRMAEAYVVSEYNRTVKEAENRAKSIAQAYGGFQKGENRVCDIMIKQIARLQAAGYKMLEIGHTKIKTKEDILSGVKYEMLSCSLDNKYFNILKDKVNLVAMCYFEDIIDNLKDYTNPFDKKKGKKGDLVARNRIMSFDDDANAIDTKSHFHTIIPKAPLSAQNFIDAVTDALKKIKEEDELPKVKTIEETKKEMEEVKNEVVEKNPVENKSLEEALDEIDDEPPFELDDEVEEKVSPEALVSEIQSLFVSAQKETKKKVKEILIKNSEDGKVSAQLPIAVLQSIVDVLKDM